MKLFAWLLGAAAITLDNAMYYTVVHMGSYINGLSAVGVAWRILRDIGNIILIFGFIILALKSSSTSTSTAAGPRCSRP